MVKSGDVLEAPELGIRVEFRQTAAETGGELLEIDVLGRPRGFLTQEHVHTAQAERIEVLRGEYTLVVDGVEHALGAGASMEVPPGTPHRQLASGTGDPRVRISVRPAGRTDAFLERLTQFHADGRLTALGLPAPHRGGRAVSATSATRVDATRPPVAVQRVLSAAILDGPPAARRAVAIARARHGAPARGQREYVFVDEWDVAAPPDAVFDALADARSYPQWWRRCTSTSSPTATPALGQETRQHFKGRLPYHLHTRSTITRLERPRVVQGDVDGDLRGRGHVDADPEPRRHARALRLAGVRRPPLLRMLSPALRPRVPLEPRLGDGPRPRGTRALRAPGRNTAEPSRAAASAASRRGPSRRSGSARPTVLAADQHPHDLEAVVEHDDVGGGPDGQPAEVGAAGDAGGHGGGGQQRGGEVDAEAVQAAHAVEQRSRAAGQRPVGPAHGAVAASACTGGPPRLRVPTASLTSATRPAAARQATSSVSSARWWPSAMSCTSTSSRASAASASAGSRAAGRRIALNRCVTVRAPRSNAAWAWAAPASECPHEAVTPRATSSSTSSSAPGSSGASVIWRTGPASSSRRRRARSGARTAAGSWAPSRRGQRNGPSRCAPTMRGPKPSRGSARSAAHTASSAERDERRLDGGDAVGQQRRARAPQRVRVRAQEVDVADAVDLQVDEPRHGDPAPTARADADRAHDARPRPRRRRAAAGRRRARRRRRAASPRLRSGVGEPVAGELHGRRQRRDAVARVVVDGAQRVADGLHAPARAAGVVARRLELDGDVDDAARVGHEVRRPQDAALRRAGRRPPRRRAGCWPRRRPPAPAGAGRSAR